MYVTANRGFESQEGLVMNSLEHNYTKLVKDYLTVYTIDMYRTEEVPAGIIRYLHCDVDLFSTVRGMSKSE